jgi:hypothetical protein
VVARYHQERAAARGRGDEAWEAVGRAMAAVDHQAERIIAAPAAVTLTGFGIKAHAMAWPVADWWTDDTAGACECMVKASIEQQIAAAGLPLLLPDPVREHVA